MSDSSSGSGSRLGTSGIVVAVDGSDGSRLALEAAVDVARAYGQTLRVVHAYSVSDAHRDAADPVPANVELRRRAEAVVAEILDRAAADLATVDVVTEVLAVRGRNAAQALVDASKGATMLVVGSRGLDGFSGLLLGSVSQQCVQHAQCPVLVVPAGDARTD